VEWFERSMPQWGQAEAAPAGCDIVSVTVVDICSCVVVIRLAGRPLSPFVLVVLVVTRFKAGDLIKPYCTGFRNAVGYGYRSGWRGRRV
jgi:hypothetical protein